MATQLLFSDLMAAAAVVASSSSSSVATGLTNTLSNSVLMDPSPAANFYGVPATSNGPTNGGSTSTKGNNYLEDQRALQLAFELSMLNNNGGSNHNNNGGSSSGSQSNGVAGSATDAPTNGVSNSSSMSSPSSMGHSSGAADLNPAFYHHHNQQQQHGHHHHNHQQQRQQGTSRGMENNGHDYENVLQHFLGNGSHESVLNNLGSTAGQSHYHPAQQQQNYDDMTLEKFLLNQNLTNNGTNGDVASDYFNSHPHHHHQQQQQGHQQQRNSHHLNHHNATTLNNLINGISSINLNNLNGSVHGYSAGSGGGHAGNGAGNGGGGGGGMMNETERFKKSQNMTECVPVPSSEHVAEIVGRQGCKIKALRAKTNTYIKTPVRGEEPVFVVTGRKEDVAKAKKEILSAAEHFSLIRASRKPSLTGGSAGSGSVNGVNSMAGSPLLSAASGAANCLGDIFSSSSSGDDSPSILTKNPIGLTSAAAAAAAAGHNQITVQVRVPYRVVGLVVGPKGATIKNIQQQTHTYIVTPSRDKEPIFEVTGAVENVEIARQQIEAHIAMRTGGNSESSDNLSSYLNSIAGSRNGLDLNMKKELQDELQLLNENFGQSTNFLRKYLNGQADDQDAFAGAFNGGAANAEPKHQAANLAAMELLVSQLYNQENQLSGGTATVNDVNDMPSSVDLFGNRIRIDELLQSMQQKQSNATGSGDLKRDADLLMSRNIFSSTADYATSNASNTASMKGLKSSDYYGSFAGETLNKIGQFGGGSDDQGLMRRQLLSNNSEDDEGVGLELQESSPPATNIMKMIMDGTEENKKYLWNTLSAAVNSNGGSASGVGMGKATGELSHVNHSSDSSCLSSASPSPTLSKFFTFQNGSSSGAGAGAQGAGGNKERASQEGETETDKDGGEALKCEE